MIKGITSLLAFAIFFSFSFMTKAQHVNISVELTGKVASSVKEVSFYYSGVQKRKVLEKDQKTFTAELEMEKAQFVELKTGGSVSSFIYMIPGDTMGLKIEKRTLNETLIEITAGNARKINEVMNRFYATFNKYGISTLANNWVESLFNKPDLAEKAINNGIAFLNENESFFKSVAPDFRNDYIIFTEAFKIYISIDSYSLDELEKILKQISHSEMQLSVLTIPFYREYLTDITLAYAARKLERYDLTMEFLKFGYVPQTIAAEACVTFIPNQGVINYLLYDKINKELAGNGIKHRQYIDYLFAHTEESVTKSFRERYEKLKANTVSKEKTDRMAALDFEFQDAQGKAYHLADFRGKVLFIDFWASWCGPCKIQLPYLKELEKKYEGKDIVFAKVSLDNSKPAWLKGVESEGLKGVVLHASGAFKNPFPVHYGITSIPRFMLIDAEGKIISDNAPRPQNKEEISALIDADLYKAELRQIIDKHLAALGAGKLMEGKIYNAQTRQSMMGIEIDHQTWYSFPKNFKHQYKPEYNELFAMSLGEEFFKERTLIIRGDSISGDVQNLNKVAAAWTARLPGWEIFIRTNVEKKSLDFAEENFNNTDNQYVLKATFEDKIEKYFIDKNDFLIKKVIQTSLLDPRKGGGKLDAPIKYEEYENVDGVMIPRKYTMNNLLNYKNNEARLIPFNEAIFK